MAAKSKEEKKPTQASRRDQLRELAARCNKQLGVEGKVIFGSDADEKDLTIERIPTGLLSLDYVTGGGLPRCRLTELYGDDGSGKTLAALSCAAAAQRHKGLVVWVVGEEFDFAWAKAQGVNTDELVLVDAVDGGKALETKLTILESGLADLIVLDSYQSLGTERELSDGVEAEAYAGSGVAQLWGRVMRRALSAFNSKKSRAAILGISQVREKIGARGMNGQKPDPEPTNIRALKHWKSVSVQCKKGEIVFDDEKSLKRKVVTREFHMRCKKNKTAPPERSGTYVYRFVDPKGVDKAREALAYAKVFGLVQVSGSWLAGYEMRAQGDDGFLKLLSESPKTVQKMQADVLREAARR